MAMKIWELHGLRLNGEVRSTPEGQADVAGLVFSEKAYLLAIRDFRPAELVQLVSERGATAAAFALVAHYRDPKVLNTTGGRGLAAVRGHGPEPMLKRSDEVRVAAFAQELSPATR